MIDDDSDWMSLEEAIADVQTAVGCHQERANKLLCQAEKDLKVGTRMLSSPTWLVTMIDGREVYSDKIKEFYRKDVLKFCAQYRSGSTQSAAPKAKPRSRPRPVSDGILKAIKTLWPCGFPQGLRAKVRNKLIREWLESNNWPTLPNDAAFARAVQRVIRENNLGDMP